MSIGEDWVVNQQNLIGFVMIDSSGNEVAGLSLSGNISKNGLAAGAMAGSFTEITGMTGHYNYLSSTVEANAVGIVNIEVTGVGAVQQNLEYAVQVRTPGAVLKVYVVLDPSNNPVEGVSLWVTVTNDSGAPVVWTGVTDALGVPKDSSGNDLLLDPGSPYYFWRDKPGYTFANPDTEAVP